MGSIDLRADGGLPLDAVLAQPKRLAFLAFLAVEAHGGYVRRDALVALFWPGLDEKHARQNLRQTLHELRRATHPDLFVTRGTEEVGLSRDVLECDATSVMEAIDAAQPQRALELYGGEFLRGFHLAEAREFSGWLDRTRERFARHAADAASYLTRIAWTDGDVERALDAGRRALALSPYDEGRLRQLLEMLVDTGRRASAVAEYRRFAARLEAELGIEPSPETVAFVESFAPPSNGATNGSGQIAKPSPDEPIAWETEVGPAIRTSSRGWRRFVPIAGGLVVAVSLVVSLIPDETAGSRPRPDPRLIAALPFETDGADPQTEPYGGGIVHLLYHALAEREGPQLANPSTSFDLWDAGSKGSPEARDSTAMEVAARLGAGRLLQGALVGTGEDLIVQARLHRVPDGGILATATVEGSLDALPEMVEKLALELLAEGESPVPDIVVADVPTPVLAEYVSGLQAFRDSRWKEAFEHFRAAIHMDSTFTPPALQMLLAARLYYGEPPGMFQEASRLAWSLKDRMSAGDRAHLMVILGPGFEEGHVDSGLELIRSAEAGVAAAPDRPQMYETLARFLLYYGPAAGIDDWADRGAEALDRAFELTDRPLDRMVTIRLVTARHESASDAAKRAKARSLLSHWSTPQWSHRFFAYIGTKDTTFLTGGPIPRTAGNVWTLGNWTTYEGLSTTPWERAVDSLERRALSDEERMAALARRFQLTAARGRPSDATRMLRTLVDAAHADFGGPPGGFLTTPIHRALIEPGWDEAAAWASSLITAPAALASLPESLSAYEHACVLGLAAVVRDDAVLAAELQKEVRRHRTRGICADLIGALIEAHRSKNGTTPSLDRLETAMRVWPREGSARWVANAVLAQLWWERGDPVRALGAARRRGRASGWTLGTPAQMLVEARSRAALGETARAIDAYEGYLRLRSDPDEWMRPRVDSARAELLAIDADR